MYWASWQRELVRPAIVLDLKAMKANLQPVRFFTHRKKWLLPYITHSKVRRWRTSVLLPVLTTMVERLKESQWRRRLRASWRAEFGTNGMGSRISEYAQSESLQTQTRHLSSNLSLMDAGHSLESLMCFELYADADRSAWSRSAESLYLLSSRISDSRLQVTKVSLCFTATSDFVAVSFHSFTDIGPRIAAWCPEPSTPLCRPWVGRVRVTFTSVIASYIYPLRWGL